MTTNMTDSVRSRYKFLHMALQEAYRAGDKEAVKRLTARIAKLFA